MDSLLCSSLCSGASREEDVQPNIARLFIFHPRTRDGTDAPPPFITWLIYDIRAGSSACGSREVNLRFVHGSPYQFDRGNVRILLPYWKSNKHWTDDTILWSRYTLYLVIALTMSYLARWWLVGTRKHVQVCRQLVFGTWIRVHSLEPPRVNSRPARSLRSLGRPLR